MRVPQFLLICFVIIAMMTGIVSAKVPASGTAVVDGWPDEWNLATNSPDFWGSLTDGTSNTVYANAYVRYDCNTNTVYVLVLDPDAITGSPPLFPVFPTDFYGYLGQKTVYVGDDLCDGVGPFEFVYSDCYSYTSGYEASFPLNPPGSSDNFGIVLQNAIFDGSTWFTVSNSDYPLTVSCSAIPSPEFPSVFLPATMIIGFLGAVLLIQRTRK